MNEPRWIRLELALMAHEREIGKHGGLSGVRDQGLLESALMRPRNLYACSVPPPDLAAISACYASGIVRNHPFFDGNKRTAWVVCRTFLFINGLRVVATQEERYLAVLQLAASELTEEQFGAWLRDRLEPRPA